MTQLRFSLDYDQKGANYVPHTTGTSNKPWCLTTRPLTDMAAAHPDLTQTTRVIMSPGFCLSAHSALSFFYPSAVSGRVKTRKWQIARTQCTPAGLSLCLIHGRVSLSPLFLELAVARDLEPKSSPGALHRWFPTAPNVSLSFCNTRQLR